MGISDEQTHIDNELRRVQIQNHPNYSDWLASLPTHSRQVFEKVLKDDVTPELILLAKQAPDEQWEGFEFLRVIGGGNPSQAVQIDLTNVTLLDILESLDTFGGG